MRAKKILALVMATALVGSLCACGSGNDDTGNQQAEASKPADSQQESTSSEEGRSGESEIPAGFPLEEEVTLTVFAEQLSYVVDLEQNTVFQDLEEYTNVNLELTLVPSDGVAEKLNLMLSSGEYPDIIIGNGRLSNQDLEKYGVEEHILMPLNDLIDKYGTNIKERWAEHPSWEEDMKSSDGNIYGIPNSEPGEGSHGDCAYKLWINTEWLKAVGKEMPTTTEEFKDVLMAFKTQDPNGNGIADEIPLTGAIKTWAAEPYLNLLNAFGFFDTNYYYVKDGVVQSVLDQDYMKEGLKYIHDLYENGLIDSAALTQDESQLAAIGNNEEIAIAGAATCGHVGMFVDINNAERYNQYKAMMPLKGSNGYQGMPYNKAKSISGASFAITDTCKYPEIAIQIADLFCGDEWALRSQQGRQGETWDVSDGSICGTDGVTPAKYKYLSYKTMADADQSVDTWDHTLRLLGSGYKYMFEVDGDIMDPKNYEARLYRDTMEMEKYAADVDPVPALTFIGEDGAVYSQISTALGDYASNAIVEFITGTRDIDADWNSYLADLEKLQYKEMLDLIQKTIDAQ